MKLALPTYTLFRVTLLVVVTCLSSFVMHAQDPHFSQFYSSPMTLNPAMTGVFSGETRLAMTYRNQWRTVSTPFTTATVACDFQLLNGRIGNDILGVGFMGLVDQSNNQGLKANFISFSAAYNKNIDQNGFHKIGVGFQSSWTTKKVDYGRFVFSRQFTPFGFDPGLSTGEPINGFALSYLDVAAGFLYSGMNASESQWYVGGSYYHLNRPNEAIGMDQNRLSPRLSVHSGFNFLFTERNRLYLSGLYMNSMITEELLFGTVFETLIPNIEYETSLYTGVYYRVNDAIIPYFGFGTTKMQLGISYDINISSLKTATRSRGGFEISLQTNLSQDPERSKIPRCYNKF